MEYIVIQPHMDVHGCNCDQGILPVDEANPKMLRAILMLIDGAADCQPEAREL